MTSDVKTANTDGFGPRLLAIRKARGVNQRWLARECGLSCAYVCQLELGQSLPSASVLERLADVLGYTMDELWRGAENPTLARFRDAAGTGASLREHYARAGSYPAATDLDRDHKVRDGAL
jgi:transcriptional regulator with XRE-family HTH domain